MVSAIFAEVMRPELAPAVLGGRDPGGIFISWILMVCSPPARRNESAMLDTSKLAKSTPVRGESLKFSRGFLALRSTKFCRKWSKASLMSSLIFCELFFFMAVSGTNVKGHDQSTPIYRSFVGLMSIAFHPECIIQRTQSSAQLPN